MRFRVHLVGAGLLLALAIWLSSGTMAPYGSTFFRPVVSTPCGYLYNYDHAQYRAVFEMLDGQPPERWRGSLVLRRLLLPLVAYPLMKAAGFEVGGFVASLLCHLAALVVLGIFLRRRHGEDAAVAGVWLFAVYPGVTYWAALPYANAAIVPASVGLFALLTRLDEETRAGRAALLSAAMGLLFVAYDLGPFFGVAAIILLLRRRRFALLPIALGCLAAGPLLASLLLKLAFHVPWTNTNTALYGTVARAWLHPPGLGVWLRSLADFPFLLVRVFFTSNFLFLPGLFLILLAIARQRLTPAEGALAAAVGLVFLFNNLAPPYEDRWQMRGDFIPRLYQPLFIALLAYAARVIGGWRSASTGRARVLLGAAALAWAGNASVAFGPIGRVPWAGYVYHRFYMHAGPETMDTNLALAGRRPLGFCRQR
jgi:hypothetical protein